MVAQRLQLVPTGKASVTTPTGLGSTNTYLVDIALPFGDPGQGAPVHISENASVMEYCGNHPFYQGLLGRDILCLGVFSMVGYDQRYTFCL